MKTLLFLTVFVSGISFAQTNVIAAKSHSSDLSKGIFEMDNFGDPMPYRTIQEVKFLKDDCIVEKYSVEWGDHLVEYDTICDHPFLKSNTIDIRRIKAMYPEETKFKGFERLEKAQNKQEKKLKNSQNQNKENSSVMIIFLVGLGGFLLYLFTPKLNKVRA